MSTVYAFFCVCQIIGPAAAGSAEYVATPLSSQVTSYSQTRLSRQHWDLIMSIHFGRGST